MAFSLTAKGCINNYFAFGPNFFVTVAAVHVLSCNLWIEPGVFKNRKKRRGNEKGMSPPI